jgi:hypothetical protein
VDAARESLGSAGDKNANRLLELAAAFAEHAAGRSDAARAALDRPHALDSIDVRTLEGMLRRAL